MNNLKKLKTFFLFITLFFLLSQLTIGKEITNSEDCILFKDDFERKEIGTNWIIVDDAPSSDWKIQDGKLVQNSNVYRADSEYDYFQGTHIVTKESFSDFIFSFDLTSTDDDGIGAVFRYQDKNNYYRFIMVKDPQNKGPFRRIDKIVNGKPFQVLAIDKNNAYEVGKKYRITIEAVGNQIKVFIDDKEILSAQDDTFKTGKLGFMTYANTGYFDNVCVSIVNNKTTSSENLTSFNWTGTWDTTWGKMYLVQVGNMVIGYYEHDNGKVAGKVIDNKLIGIWLEAPSYSPPKDGGEFELTLSPDGTSFTGRWRYGNSGDWNTDWEGKKISDIVPSQEFNIRSEKDSISNIIEASTKEKTVISPEEASFYDKGEKVIQSEMNIGPSGGEIVLSDGTKLLIPPNTIKEDTKISIKSITNPIFYSKEAKGIEISGIQKLFGEITLVVNGPKALTNDELNIFGYDHINKGKLDLEYEYNPSTGIISIKLSPSLIYRSSLSNIKLCYNTLEKISADSNTLSLKDRLFIYIGYIPKYTPKQKEKIIRMPYYEQIGGSCVSTSALMFLKFSGKDIELYDILRELGANDSDFGLDEDQIVYSLKDYLSKETGFTAYSVPIFKLDHLKWRVLSEIDKGHPVILSWGDHAVVLLGYTENGEKIIMHDPQNISPANNENGTMYTIRDWNFIKNRHKFPTEKYIIIVVDGNFATSPSLSLELPARDEKGAMTTGDISFLVRNPNNQKLVPFYQLQIKPSESKDGYIWVKSTGDKLEIIPQDAEVLNLKLYIYNGSNYSRDIEVYATIDEGRYGIPGKRITYNRAKFTIPEAKFNEANYITYNHQFKLEDIRDLTLGDKDGKQEILIRVGLWEGDLVRDSFSIKAVISLIPKVLSIEPNTGSPGDIITIKGLAFGKNQSSKSKVMIGNTPAEILSWNDKEIKIKVPENVQTGPVVVYVGEKYTYESNKDVNFNAKTKVKTPLKRNLNGIHGLSFTLPEWVHREGKWYIETPAVVYLKFSDGSIEGVKEEGYHTSIASGSYNDENLMVYFEWSFFDDGRDYWNTIVKGKFEGKIRDWKYQNNVIGVIIEGEINCTVRCFYIDVENNKTVYDVQKDFILPGWISIQFK